jgi:hypothetical protein
VFLPLAVVSVASLPLNAQPAPAAAPAEAIALAEVTAVKFAGARWGSDNWFEAEIEVTAKPGGRAVSGQFVDRVRVTLSLGVEASDEKGTKKMTFYRSSVEAITLEGGGKSTFRFYLPPEVVSRDKLRPDVKYYVVELEAGGQAQPAGRANASTDFKSAESVKNFLSKVSAEAGPNEGILMPQHLSPFAYDSQRRAPSVLRREGQR